MPSPIARWLGRLRNQRRKETRSNGSPRSEHQVVLGYFVQDFHPGDSFKANLVSVKEASSMGSARGADKNNQVVGDDEEDRVPDDIEDRINDILTSANTYNVLDDTKKLLEKPEEDSGSKMRPGRWGDKSTPFSLDSYAPSVAEPTESDAEKEVEDSEDDSATETIGEEIQSPMEESEEEVAREDASPDEEEIEESTEMEQEVSTEASAVVEEIEESTEIKEEVSTEEASAVVEEIEESAEIKEEVSAEESPDEEEIEASSMVVQLSVAEAASVEALREPSSFILLENNTMDFSAHNSSKMNSLPTGSSTVDLQIATSLIFIVLSLSFFVMTRKSVSSKPVKVIEEEAAVFQTSSEDETDTEDMAKPASITSTSESVSSNSTSQDRGFADMDYEDKIPDTPAVQYSYHSYSSSRHTEVSRELPLREDPLVEEKLDEVNELKGVLERASVDLQNVELPFEELNEVVRSIGPIVRGTSDFIPKIPVLDTFGAFALDTGFNVVRLGYNLLPKPEEEPTEMVSTRLADVQEDSS